jgi:polysaccharide biosynthesis transport protein
MMNTSARRSLAPLLVFYSQRLKPHWFSALAAFTTVTALSTVLAFTQKATYEAEGKMVLRRASPTSVFTEVGKEVDRLDALSNLGNPALTQAEIIQSTQLTQDVIKALDLRDAKGKPLSVSDFKRRLTVSAVNATDVLKVSFKDGDPKRASDIVNQLMAQYLKKSIQGNQEEVVKAKQFIQKQVPEAETELHRAETTLRQFLQANQLIELKEKVKASEGRTNDLQRQIGDIQSQIANTEAQMTATSQKLGMSPDQAIAFASLSQSSEIQDVLKNIQATESQLIQDRNRFTEDHPSVVLLENNLANYKNQLQQKSAQILNAQQKNVAVPDANLLIGALKQDLSADLVRLDSTRQGLLKQSKDLSSTLISYKQKSTDLPQLVQQQNELERKVESAQIAYRGLSQKLKDTEIAEKQTQGNVRIAASAIPPEKPAGLTKPIIIGSGIFFGILAGAAVAFFLETMGQMVRTAEDAENAFDLKVLGIIPTSGRSRNLLLYDGRTAYHIPEVAVRDRPGSPASEAYRLLQGHLKVLHQQRRQRVMLVTSATPEEGTSSVCANLGAAIAQTQRRVLIIDANLHAPVQDEIWFISQMEGLSNLLIENVSLWTVVHNVAPNLDVLPFGNAVSDAPFYLDNARMEALVEHFSNLYDLVILDTPALTVSADTALLGSMADTILLVARPNHLDYGSISAALPIVEQWGDRVLGLVINGVPLNQATYSYSLPEAPISPTDGAFQSQVSSAPLQPSQRLPQFSTQGDLESSLSAAVNSTVEPTFELRPEVRYEGDQSDLSQLSAVELQQLVETLSQDWLKATRLIREQEEELDLQSQTVSELQSRLHTARDYHRHAASEYDKLSLEVQLADEEERKRLLDQTLGGQRRRLRGQHETLRQALEILRVKQDSSATPTLPKLDRSSNSAAWLKRFSPPEP